MMLGQLILAGALFVGVAALVAVLLDRSDRLVRALTWLLMLLVGGAILLLALQLVAGDFAVRYVWQHSATYQPVSQRLAALVAGSEGSLLVWLLLASAVAAWGAGRHARGRWPDRGGGRLILSALLGVAVVVGIASLISSPFQSLAEFAGVAAAGAVAEGMGLNPVLTNRWMAPHTVLTLAAFALVGLAAAVGFLQLVRLAQARPAEAEGWERERIGVSRRAWLVLTLALFTGIVWAYEEMTFGWFWSWDPVESATLAVWLVLTAALHAPRADAARGRWALAGPALTAGAFGAVLFASLIARSGLHPSVHAFAGGPAGLLFGGLLIVLIPVLAIALAYAWRRTAAARLVAAQRSRAAAGASSAPVRSRPSLVSWAAVLIAVAGGLVLWGLAYPILASRVFGNVTNVDAAFFSLVGYAVAIGALLLLGAGLAAADRRLHERLALFGGFAMATVVAASVAPADGLTLLPAADRAELGGLLGAIGQVSVLSLFPAAVYAVLGIAERLSARLRSRDRLAGGRPSVVAVGHAALHAGLVVVLVGVTLSTLLSSSTTVAAQPAESTAEVSRSLTPATLVATGGVSVRMRALRQTEHRNVLGQIVELRETASLEVLLNGSAIAGGEASVSTYPERAMGRHARVLIDRGALHDTQVIFHGVAEAQPAGIPVTVRRVPLTNLVWAGMALFVIGMTLVQLGTPGSSMRQPRRSKGAYR